MVDVPDLLALEPVTLADAKANLGVRTGHRDAEIQRLVVAARGLVEDYSSVTLTRRTVVETFGGFTGAYGGLSLSRRPVHSVVAVRYLDADGLLQPAAGARVLALASGPVVMPAVGGAWPALVSPALVEVEMVAGFGPDAEGELDEGEFVRAPEQLVQAIHMLVANWFENHEGAVVGAGAVELPFGVRELCRSFRPAGIA